MDNMPPAHPDRRNPNQYVPAAVCLDWATDIIFDQKAPPVKDAIAERGIEDATDRKLKAIDTYRAWLSCKVLDCPAFGRLAGYEVGSGRTRIAVTVESVDSCPRRQPQ